MRNVLRHSWILVVFILLTALVVSGETQFEKLKSLEGEWQGSAADGNLMNVEYRIISGGTAVMEIARIRDNKDLLTVYFVDGDDLMLTHFGENGIPQRMKWDKQGQEKLVFRNADSAHRLSRQNGADRKLILSWIDPYRVTQEWIHRESDKDSTEVFRLFRKEIFVESYPGIDCAIRPIPAGSWLRSTLAGRVDRLDLDCSRMSVREREKQAKQEFTKCPCL